jgi:large subunit ribosomal protein L24
MRILKGDVVVVLSGDDKGKTGRILRLVEDGARVVVEGVNLQWRHKKPSPGSPKGGRIRREGAIHASKVMPLDPKTGKPTRVGSRVEGGKKVRVARRSGEPLPAPARN